MQKCDVEQTAIQRRSAFLLGLICLIAGIVVPFGFEMLWEAGLFYGGGRGLVGGLILFDGFPMIIVGIAAIAVSVFSSDKSSLRPVVIGLYCAATLVAVSTLLLLVMVWLPMARGARITMATTLNLQGLPIVILVGAGIVFLLGYFSQK